MKRVLQTKFRNTQIIKWKQRPSGSHAITKLNILRYVPSFFSSSLTLFGYVYVYDGHNCLLVFILSRESFSFSLFLPFKKKSPKMFKYNVNANKYIDFSESISMPLIQKPWNAYHFHNAFYF